MRIRATAMIWLVGLFVLTQPVVALEASGSEKFALLVGINDYRWSNGKSFKDLQGSINDVTTIKDLLIKKYHFSPTNIRTLVNEQATRNAILMTFRRFLVEQAKRDDIVLFYYSGHGSRITDDNGDETDQLDETLVPYDGRDPAGRVRDIRDDTINRFLRKLSINGAHSIVILDSCHSGSGARGRSPAQARWVEMDQPRTRKQDHLEISKADSDRSAGFLASLPNYTAITASADDENAYEIKIGNKMYGAFSSSLIKTLTKLPLGTSYYELILDVRTNIAGVLLGQHPQLEGDLDSTIFELPRAEAVPLVSAERIDRQHVRLEVGEIHGATKDSIFRIFEPVHDGGSLKRELALAKLIDVQIDHSTAQIVKGKMSIARAVAEEVEHNHGDLKLRVLIDPANDQAFSRIAKALAEWRVVDTVTQLKSYDLRVYVDNGSVILEQYDGTPLGRPLPIEGEDPLAELKKRLQKFARYRSFLMLSNQRSRLGVKINVTRLNRDVTGASVWSLIENTTGRGDFLINAGDKVRFEVTNTSSHGQRFYVYVFYLGADYGVRVIYPSRGATDNELIPRSKVVTLSGTARGFGRRDIIKVIATTKPVNVWHLQQPGIPRQTFKSPLERLLHEAFIGGRDIGETSVPVLDWQTAYLATLTVSGSE